MALKLILAAACIVLASSRASWMRTCYLRSSGSSHRSRSASCRSITSSDARGSMDLIDEPCRHCRTR